jgi:hypothetical protein
MKFPIIDYDADIEDNIKHKYCFKCKKKINKKNKKINKISNLIEFFDTLQIKS